MGQTDLKKMPFDYRFAAFGAGESTSLRILREDRSNKKDSDSDNDEDDDEDDSRKQTVSER